MSKVICVLAVFIIALSSSCGLDDKQLSPEERYTVDTLFGNNINQLRTYTDSLCSANRDTLFSKYTDSIKSVRIKEIESLLIINPEQE